ncbi:magnesium transporter NIPA-domain-containing protein [Phakopsora pachyrhizi]|nr:magnesium transporter NIPA-domain-containing protein [Phakopsora pachyrhizi]
MGLLEDKYIGLALAISSSIAIGTSFGLIDAADRTAGSSSKAYNYLKNPIWWAGMVTIANFAAYTFAPPILVTPLGSLSVLIGAVLASFFLKEELGRIGKIGCALCLIGSIIIVLHAPQDKEIETVDEILSYALHPGFMFYCLFVLVFSLFMIYKVAPVHGTREPTVYISICSLVGSVSVMAIKGFGVAVKLTLSGHNQLTHLPTYVFALVVAGCIVVQMNYFNKALDQFSTNVVNPIYYVFFSTATIISSLILFRGFGTQDAVNTLSLIMGFIVTFLGVYLLNICRTDPGGTANNVSSLERSLESGVIHPRMSLNGTRLSLSSDRENQLTHHPIHKSYHRSSGGLPSPSNPFGNNNSAGGGNKKSGGRRMGLYDHRNHSQDSVLFEAFPEESVGLTLMNNTSDEEEEDGNQQRAEADKNNEKQIKRLKIDLLNLKKKNLKFNSRKNR